MPLIHALLDSFKVYEASDNIAFLLNCVFEPEELETSIPCIGLIFSFSDTMNGGYFIRAFLESSYFAEQITEAITSLSTLRDMIPSVGYSESPYQLTDCFISHLFVFLRRLLLSRWEGGILIGSNLQIERSVLQADDVYQYLVQKHATQPLIACDWELIGGLASRLAILWDPLIEALTALSEGEPQHVCPLALIDGFHLVQTWLLNPHVQKEWPTSSEDVIRVEAALARSIQRFPWNSKLHSMAKRFYRAVIEEKNMKWTEGGCVELG